MSYRETSTSSSGVPTGATQRSERHVHAVSIGVELSIGPSTLDERFATASGGIRSRVPETCRDDVSLVLFQESVPHAAGSSRARALCERELSRGLAPATGGALRVIQLRFDDGSGRLIATADRAVASKLDLHRLLGQLVGGHAGTWPIRATVDTDAADSRDWAVVAAYPPIERWCGPGEGEGSAATATVTVPGHAGDLLVALARVFHAFCRGQEGCLPVLRDTQREATSSWDLVALAVNPLQSALDARAAGYAAVSFDEGGPGEEDLARLADLWGSVAEFLVGVVLSGNTLDDVDGGFDATYVPFQVPPFPITLVAETTLADTLLLSVRYDRRAIGKDDAERLLTCVSHVMSAIATSADRPLSRIPLVSDEVAAGLLAVGAGRHGVRLLSNQRLEQRIATLAQARPDAIAITDEVRTVSYRELDDEATRMASNLASRGIGRGDRIGVCMQRSAGMLIAALAVMKTGAVYIPVDPDSPAERIAYVCEDAGMSLLVFDNDAQTDTAGVPGLSLAEWLAGAATTASSWQPEAACSIDDPAYMIYTSGSTGRPKGVLVAHRNVQALLGAVKDDFALSDTDVWSLFHSFAFDFSVWEAWGALLTGAQVHVVSYDVTRDTDAFLDEVNARGITVLSQTPSAFGGLVMAERTRPIGPSLRLVIFGGEPLDARMLLPWFDRHPEGVCRLVNMFGITETTVHVTAKDIRRREALAGSRSVGRPIDGWSVRVLAHDGSQLPMGVDGEIYVAGAGVALGYHERAELNTQRFVTDPAGNARMYRSGDRGRMQPNGELLHLGRLDNQVKLRGFRIELDEIRNVLLRCRGVEAAAVTFEQRDPADPATARIDAYVVMEAAGLRDLWTQAAQALPDYMMPSSIARVSAMPLTGNGKLHAKKLEGCVIERTGPAKRLVMSTKPVAPKEGEGKTDGLKEQLVEIWSEIFARRVTADDNFFDLGGNSLLAIRMSARLRDRGLPGMNLRDLYVHQTVSGLALGLSAQGAMNAVTITREGTP